MVRAYLYMARVDATEQLTDEQVSEIKAKLDAHLEPFLRELGYGFHEVRVGPDKSMEDLGNLELEGG